MEFDTIAAVSTALGESGIGIVRVSGPEALDVADRIFESAGGEKINGYASHTLHLGRAVDPEKGEVIDEVLLTVMRAPHSFTREDVVEINCHGGVVPVLKILEAALASGARMAEPGEFSRRAFLNGRIDLSQAEAIIDIVRAKNEEGLSIAVKNLEGSLSKEIEDLRESLAGILARVEVNLDFPGEDLEAEMDAAGMAEVLEAVSGRIQKLLQGAREGKILREGLRTVIVGKPNVGKSSLLNALLKEKRAIVTEVPGTTRDVIEEVLNLGGVPVRIVDTAGLRHTKDVVERMGVLKTEEAIQAADLVLFVVDAASGFAEEDAHIAETIQGKQSLGLVNKVDLVENVPLHAYADKMGTQAIAVSAKTGFGLDVLGEKIREIVCFRDPGAENALVTRARHEQALRKALELLDESAQACKNGVPMDLAVLDAKQAWNALGEITGDALSEDIVNRIFEDFCIGK